MEEVEEKDVSVDDIVIVVFDDRPINYSQKRGQTDLTDMMLTTRLCSRPIIIRL